MRYLRAILCLTFILLLLASCGKPAGESSESTIAPGDVAPPEVSEEESEPESLAEEESPEPAVSEESSEISQESPEEESIEEESTPVVLTYLDLSHMAGARFTDILNLVASRQGEEVWSSYAASYEELVSRAEGLYSRLPEEAKACFFPMEGYLLPLNYELGPDDSLPEAMLDQSLSLIQEKMDQAGTSMSMHEVLTRASIVQIEASLGTNDSNLSHPEVMAHIASVIENRLSSGTPLQMDVTAWYAQDLIEIFSADASFEERYNTYQAAALPLGPIASPSVEAIEAVLHPESTNDLFFVYDEAGNYYFAPTYEEHLENCEKAGLY